MNNSKSLVDTRDYLGELVTIINRLNAYYTDEEAVLWLRSPHPQLEGPKPIDLISWGDGHLVVEVLDRLDAGVYL